MDNEIILALSKYFNNLAKGLDIAPGNIQIDTEVVVRLEGELVRKKDFQRAPTVSIPLIPTMALLIQRLGIQRETAKALIFEVMLEAILDKSTLEEKYELFETHIKDVEAAMEHVQEITQSLPKVDTKGGLLFHLHAAEVLEAQPA